MRIMGMYKLDEKAPYFLKNLHKIWQIIIPIAYIIYLVPCVINIKMKGMDDIGAESFNILTGGEFNLIL